MFLNDNISVMKTDEMYLLFNFSNGIVAGVDSQAIEFLKRVKNHQLNCNDLTDEEKEFFTYLVENDFISDVEFKNEQPPITAYLHLTNKCNLHCVGCYSFDERRNRCEDLSTEEILNAIDQLSDVGIQNLVFSGGEPLLRKNILQIVEYAKKVAKIPNVILITNGTIFNKKILSELSKFVDTVSVSLDTYCSDSEPYLRDKGIFDKIMRSISWLKESGNNVNIIPTIHHLNSSNLLEYVKLAKELGTTISFSILSACFEGELMSYLPDNTDLINISKFMIESDAPINDSALEDKTLVARNYCGAGTSMIAIGTQGNVYPCHMLMYDEYCIGNIKYDSINKMREKSVNARLFRSLNVDKIEGCSQCQFRYLCGGGCRARSKLKFDVVDKVDPYCRLFKAYYNKVATEIISD